MNIAKFLLSLRMKKQNLHPIVANVNKIMTDRKLSKSEFASLCGLAEPKWNKISNGAQELSLWDLSKIAEKLHMSLIDIVTYPQRYVVKDAPDAGERVSITFEVSPDKRDMLLGLVTQNQ